MFMLIPWFESLYRQDLAIYPHILLAAWVRCLTPQDFEAIAHCLPAHRAAVEKSDSGQFPLKSFRHASFLCCSWVWGTISHGGFQTGGS